MDVDSASCHFYGTHHVSLIECKVKQPTFDEGGDEYVDNPLYFDITIRCTGRTYEDE